MSKTVRLLLDHARRIPEECDVLLEIYPRPGSSVLLYAARRAIRLESEEVESGTAMLHCKSKSAALLGLKVLKCRRAGNEHAVWVSKEGVSIITTCTGEIWLVPWTDV